MISAIHHIQLAMPAGGEDAARAFYGGALGFAEVAKPAALQGRGGVWFEAGDVRVHLGVQEPFAPATKAHPAFQVGDLEVTKAALTQSGVAFKPDVDLPGIRRVFVADPFGNRIELLEVVAQP